MKKKEKKSIGKKGPHKKIVKRETKRNLRSAPKEEEQDDEELESKSESEKKEKVSAKISKKFQPSIISSIKSSSLEVVRPTKEKRTERTERTVEKPLNVLQSDVIDKESVKSVKRSRQKAFESDSTDKLNVKKLLISPLKEENAYVYDTPQRKVTIAGGAGVFKKKSALQRIIGKAKSKSSPKLRETPLAKDMIRETPFAKDKIRETPLAKDNIRETPFAKDKIREIPLAKDNIRETPIAKDGMKPSYSVAGFSPLNIHIPSPISQDAFSSPLQESDSLRTLIKKVSQVRII